MAPDVPLEDAHQPYRVVYFLDFPYLLHIPETRGELMRSCDAELWRLVFHTGSRLGEAYERLM
jgi:hypothetical protein